MPGLRRTGKILTQTTRETYSTVFTMNCFRVIIIMAILGNVEILLSLQRITGHR